jgi:hypothetical protein
MKKWRSGKHKYTVGDGLNACIFDEDDMPIGFFETIEQANRAVACVNACAGIENPDEWIKAARRVIFWNLLR